MRLTLRTLLAYLDGNLEPDDSQDIGKKIEESEFATKLVHLIRDCARRLRLGAPPLMGRGLAADSNSVAEYLEYRLPDESVPEFERICLESEIHLAEVASCHQILTLVLGEPAEIAPETRQRLYALSAHVDAPSAEHAEVPRKTPAPTAIPPAPPAVRRPKPEVPDYLRESRWRWWPVAALVLFAATLTFAGLLAFGPPELRQRVIALVQSPATDAESSPTDEPSETTDNAQPRVADSRVSSDPAEPPQADAAAQTVPKVVAPPTPAAEDPDAPPAPEPPQPTTVEPGDPGAAKSTDLPDESLPDDSSNPAPQALPVEKPNDAAPADFPHDAPAGERPAAAEPSGNDAPREPPEGFGRYTSKREVLLRQDPETGDWLRLPAMSPLNKGDLLLSLPSFRPTITLSSNITIQADGPARFELSGWTNEGIPILSVEFGRLLMLTIGKPGNSLQLKIDGHEPVLTFLDAESTLAIDVGREMPVGNDPEAAPRPMKANVYATSGLIRVRGGNDSPVELQSPAQCSLAPVVEAQPANAEFPAWVTSEEQSDFDRLATGQVDRYLENGKRTTLQLLELADPAHRLGRRREVRSLAIRSLMYLGDFEPCVKAMNDENERLFWPLAMNELRAAVARGPKTAAQVRLAFENQRGAEAGAGLYRILWGYSNTDLRDGADRDLVEALASDSLDFRVMSFLTLQNLTGATHGYRPDDQEIKRRTAYNVWKQRIGRIAPRSGEPSKSRTPKAR